MARYVVAVSGGVDSVVLLDMIHRLGRHDLVVAHVDHGIREDSSEDAALVRGLAERHNLPFELATHALGEGASEERARQVRYDFLHSLARKHNARVVTAHHADDVVETIAINLHRGTGWRGLATHDSHVERPLLAMTKKQLYTYAEKRGLTWREDSTNQSDDYLRNRFRKQLNVLHDESREAFLALRKQQLATKRAILNEVKALIGSGPSYERYFFTHIPAVVAIECLRHITKGEMTRPQLERFLLAIKTAKPGKTIELGNGLRSHFTTRNFHLSLIK